MQPFVISIILHVKTQFLGEVIDVPLSQLCIAFVHFLCVPKENEPKERAPVTLGPAGTLRSIKSAGSLKTRCAQTVQTP
jgi:hypothetical protein